MTFAPDAAASAVIEMTTLSAGMYARASNRIVRVSPVTVALCAKFPGASGENVFRPEAVPAAAVAGAAGLTGTAAFSLLGGG